MAPRASHVAPSDRIWSWTAKLAQVTAVAMSSSRTVEHGAWRKVDGGRGGADWGERVGVGDGARRLLRADSVCAVAGLS